MLENIKRIAEEQKKSLRYIEDKLGLHNIYRWDEHKPSIDKVRLVADELGVTVDELFKDDD